MYDIIASDTAKKQLSKLSSKDKDRISAVLERIKIRPHHFVKRLVDSPYHRLRVGDYRIILDIQDKQLIIFVIELGNRSEIYKK